MGAVPSCWRFRWSDQGVGDPFDEGFEERDDHRPLLVAEPLVGFVDTCGTTAAVVVVVSGEGVAAAPLLSSPARDRYQQTRQHEARSPMSNVHDVAPS